jgi:hypothetical protein
MPSSFLRKAIVNTAFYGLQSKWRKLTNRTAGNGGGKRKKGAQKNHAIAWLSE